MDIRGDVPARQGAREQNQERTFPRARRAPSKKSITPSIMKSAPKVVNATPISIDVER